MGAHRVLSEADTGAPRTRAEEGTRAFPENRGVTHTHTQRSPGSKDLGPLERRDSRWLLIPPKTRRSRLGLTH